MSEFFKCSCGSEVIQIEQDIEIIDRNIWSANVYFAMFHYGTQNPRPTLREKLRHCWQIIKTGKNFADDVIMDIDQARKMGQYLLEVTDEVKLKLEAEQKLQEFKNIKQKQK